MNKLGIIIPLYNSHFLLDQCLNSVININMKKEEYEIILVDDCSDNQYINLYKSYVKDNIKYIRLNERSGAGIARIEGLKHTNAKYCCFMDSDDKVDPDYYNELIEVLDSENECSLVIGSIIDYNYVSNEKKIAYQPENTIIKDKNHMISYFLKDNAHNVALWNKVFRKEIFEGLKVSKGRVTFEELAFFFHIADNMNYARLVKTKSFYWYTIVFNYATKYPYSTKESLNEIKKFLKRKDLTQRHRDRLKSIIRFKLFQNRNYIKKFGSLPEC